MTTTRIYLTEEEMVTLVTEARRDKVFQCTWGTGEMLVTPDTMWAVRRLAEMRGIEVGDE